MNFFQFQSLSILACLTLNPYRREGWMTDRWMDQIGGWMDR